MSVYEHFRKEEHTFVDQVLEWKNTVEEQYRAKLTDFLDPRQQQIVTSVIGKQEEIKLSFYGGQEQAERKRCLLYPPYMEPELDAFELACYEIEYPSKFVSIEHRQILGALMNIGLRREKFGDILTDGERYQIVLAKEVSDFVSWNFTSVGKAKVNLIEVNDMIETEDNFTFMQLTVSSLRLDTVSAEVYNLSRSKTKTLIEGGFVKVNWKVIEDPSFQLQESDIVSVRGKGRFEFISNEGHTKKDKIRISVRIPK
ncbi:RNA-binding protein [Evansella sp. AB-rgal1]|uniref:YlmH family RNA-binding protein n=1 Tax=Evansella sp. AB-rgal1 TaxID=3242696 RepID=UPI00359ECCEC